MQTAKTMDGRDWALLLLLSILWGASFFFVEIAVTELPPLTIVFVRVALAALALLPLYWSLGERLPRTFKGWTPFLMMGLLNNALPFSLIVAGQTYISGGIASIVNATTPLFTVLVMFAFQEERLTRYRLIGVLFGFFGVAVLRGVDEPLLGEQSIGILLCMLAAISYGFSALWARRRLAGTPPLKSATLQLMSSSALMALAVVVVDQPWRLEAPSGTVALAMIGLALVSTSIAYLLFFKIISRAGASNAMLVTLLVPVSAIALSALVLGTEIRAQEIGGAVIIGLGLLFIDGRAVTWLLKRVDKRRAT